MKFDKVTVIGIISGVASLLGSIGTAWVTRQENKAQIQKLIEEHFKK